MDRYTKFPPGAPVVRYEITMIVDAGPRAGFVHDFALLANGTPLMQMGCGRDSAGVLHSILRVLQKDLLSRSQGDPLPLPGSRPPVPPWAVIESDTGPGLAADLEHQIFLAEDAGRDFPLGGRWRNVDGAQAFAWTIDEAIRHPKVMSSPEGEDDPMRAPMESLRDGLDDRYMLPGPKVIELPSNDVHWLSHGIETLADDPDTWEHPSCVGPLVDGTNPCVRCQEISEGVIGAARLVGADRTASDLQSQLDKWRGTDG